MGLRSRREVVKAGTMAIVAGSTGCLGAGSTPGEERAPGSAAGRDEGVAAHAWPQLAHDARNTSYNAEAAGPRSGVEVAWTAEFGRPQLFDPVVADGVFLAESLPGDTAYGLATADGSTEWETTFPGTRWPPTVYGSRVLVPSRADGNEVRLHALERQTGTEAWRVPVTASAASHPPIAPTVADDRVYVASATGVLALDGATGERRWSTHLGADVVADEGVTRKTVWETPTAWGEYVFTFDRNESVGTERRVFALDRETGAHRWTRTLTVPDEWWRFDAPVVAGERQLFVLVSSVKSGGGAAGTGSDGDGAVGEGGGRLFALDPGSGAVRWTRDFDGTTRVSALADDTLYVPEHDPNDDVHRLHAIDVRDRETDWTQTFDGIVNAVAATADAVYVDGDGLEAVDAADGTRLWRRFPGRAVGSPVVADDTVFATFAPEGDFRQTRVAAVRER